MIRHPRNVACVEASVDSVRGGAALERRARLFRVNSAAQESLTGSSVSETSGRVPVGRHREEDSALRVTERPASTCRAPTLGRDVTSVRRLQLKTRVVGGGQRQTCGSGYGCGNVHGHTLFCREQNARQIGSCMEHRSLGRESATSGYSIVLSSVAVSDENARSVQFHE